MNISGELYNTLRGSGCEAFGSDLRVRVMPHGMYAYPDVTVTAKPQSADDRQDIILNPAVIRSIQNAH